MKVGEITDSSKSKEDQTNVEFKAKELQELLNYQKTNLESNKTTKLINDSNRKINL